MTDKRDTYVGLDMSGAQARCLIAAGDGPRLHYLGCGSMPAICWDNDSRRKSQSTAESVLEAVCEAESEAGLAVVSAVVGVGSAQVRSANVHTSVRLPAHRSVVEQADLADVVCKAARGVISDSTAALQLVPLEFVVDSAKGLRNPVGMSGRRLEAYVRVISIAQADHDAVTSKVNQASFRVDETVLGAFAAAYSTLSDSEYRNGAALLDLGKGSSGLVAYSAGALSLARGIPVGRDDLVSDVARAFGTDPGAASSLVSDFGSAVHSADSSGAYVFVPQDDPGPSGEAGRLWPRDMLDKIVALRIEECMTLVRDFLQHDGLARGSVQSLVLTGDIAAIPGIRGMAQQIVGLRCRVGVPARPASLPPALRSPGWACAAGLVLYAHRLAYRPSGGHREDTEYRSMRQEVNAA